MAMTIENLIYGTASTSSADLRPAQSGTLQDKHAPTTNHPEIGPSVQPFDFNQFFSAQSVESFSFDQLLDTSIRATEAVNGASSLGQPAPQPDFLTMWAQDPFGAFSSATSSADMMQFGNFGPQGGHGW